MITKRVGIIYAFLSLFVFTFALTFTLASKAQAVPSCCILDWCYCNGEWTVSAMGHRYPGQPCVYTGWPDCDFIHECCE